MLEMSNVDNKSDRHKCHGRLLYEIAAEFIRLMEKYDNAILIREQALAMISRSAKTLQVLHKVVGVTDLYAWTRRKTEFAEVNPKTVKRLIAGKDDASKEEVATSLAKYVGEQTYACDDESDAVAVGIAWLMLSGYIKMPRRKEKKAK